MNNEKDGDVNDTSPSTDAIRQLSLDENNKIVYFGNFSQKTKNTAKTATNVTTKTVTTSPESTFDKERNRRRRSSLQTKLDRRRNRISTEDALKTSSLSRTMDIQNNDNHHLSSFGENNYNVRQKRHSWWNIFVPEQLRSDRNRRASQDITNLHASNNNSGGGSSGNINQILKTTRRSKSHSVDHGRSSFGSQSLRFNAEKFSNTRSSLPTIATKSYTVGVRDTLTSVAASFDTTPTELTQLNRLNSSFIFPGQVILVPIKETHFDDDETPNDEKLIESPDIPSSLSTSIVIEQESNFEANIIEGIRTSSPKPGHIERVTMLSKQKKQQLKQEQQQQQQDDTENDPVMMQRFLKINVRHITDGQGVVGGVLLVTPNAIMFDPNVSDPLVIEHGAENYSVIAPMELVVNIAIFYDIAHMRVNGDGESNNKIIQADIYHPKKMALKEEDGEEEDEEEDEEEEEKKVNDKEENGETIDKKINSTASNDVPVVVDEREKSTATDKIILENESVSQIVNEDGSKIIKKLNANDENKMKENENENEESLNTDLMLEERRQSLLDHHWAIPNRDETDTVLSNKNDDFKDKSDDGGGGSGSGDDNIVGAGGGIDLSNQTCYDSGIDVRDSIPIVKPIEKKAVYSDADIVLSSDWVPPKIIPTIHSNKNNSNSSIIFDMINQNGRKKASSVSFSMDDVEQQQNQQLPQKQSNQNEKTSEKKIRMLKRLSYPFLLTSGDSNSTSITGINTIGGSGNGGGKSSDSDLAASTSSNPNNDSTNQSVFSKVFSRRSSISTFIRPHSSSFSESNQQNQQQQQQQKLQQNIKEKNKEKNQQPKLDYRSMVSIDDKPELFISVDRLIPRPATTCTDPPLYLRLRMGKPIGKTIQLPTSVMSHGKNYLRSEYWFSVPKNRIDELYRFINTWMAHLYGELNEEKIKENGFELIQGNIEWSESHFGNNNNEQMNDSTSRDSWEIINTSSTTNNISISSTGTTTGSSPEDFNKKKVPSFIDLEFCMPEMIGKSEILKDEHREKLCRHLPARAEGYPWSLVFSTSQHGFSLNSLYRKMQRLECPILVVIQDTDLNIFGALTSCAIHVSDHFYGTGESILYKFNPTFKIFHWTGENLYFIKGNNDSLSIGAGNGRFGLWLDGDLNQGRSQSCSTYGNEPLAPQEDFVIKTLECWAFK